MAAQATPMNLRVSGDIRDRVNALCERYNTSMNSVAKVALVIGLEALEGLQATASEEEEGRLMEP